MSTPSMLAIASVLRAQFTDAAELVRNDPSASNFAYMLRTALAHQASVVAHGADYDKTRARIEAMTTGTDVSQWGAIVYECVFNGDCLTHVAARMSNAT